MKNYLLSRILSARKVFSIGAILPAFFLFFAAAILPSCQAPKIYTQEGQCTVGRVIVQPCSVCRDENPTGPYVYTIHTKKEAEAITAFQATPGIIRFAKSDRYSYSLIISPIFDQKKVIRSAVKMLPR